MLRLNRYRLALTLSTVGLTFVGPAQAIRQRRRHSIPAAADQRSECAIADAEAERTAAGTATAGRAAGEPAPPPASSVSNATGEIAIATPTSSAPRPLGASIANGIVNGKPVFSSNDGQFTAAIRLLGQFDAAYYMQGNPARSFSNGEELSSGENFRRAWFGIYGKAFGDWSYVANFDFGGSSGTEVRAIFNRCSWNMTA